MRETVLVTGVFDLLHPGHLALLAEVKGRYPQHQLTVGINGDRRTAELKLRVLFSADERRCIISSIRYVDDVIVFEEDTPEGLIRRMKPDVFVKGPDWRGKDLPEAGVCAEVGTEIVFIGDADENGDKDYDSSNLKRRLLNAG